ncbi:MAG: ATP-binding protein [Anaerolineales bacterium]
MAESKVPSFEDELQISPNWVIILLLVPAIIVPLVVWNIPGAPENLLNVGLLLYALCVAIWIAGRLGPRVGGWFAVFSLVVALYAFHAALAAPAVLMLLTLPTALAVPLLGTWPAVIVSGIETLLLAATGLFFPSTSGWVIAVAAIAVWIMLGIILLIYKPVKDLATWSWNYFEAAREALEEARDRQVELKEALEALAQANEELALMNERLDGMRSMAEEARRAKETFVANVSHEFRTPLNIIIGLAGVLLDAPEVLGEDLPPKMEQNLEILHRNCEHLADMIDDVLDLSQVEAGRLGLRKEWVDLGDLFDSALTVVRPLVDGKDLYLHVDLPEDLPPVECDPTRIRQVILNLMSNAARLTEEGGLRVKAEENDRYVVVKVNDTGPGISPQDVKRIFEPFQQAPAALWQGEGSGLGLPISKRFVELHHGQMWVESEPGVGSTFAFSLPISSPPEHRARSERWITEGWSQRTIRAKTPSAHLEDRLVLCDPSGELYPLFRRYGEGVEFLEAEDVDGALEALGRWPAQALLLNADVSEIFGTVAEASERAPEMPVIGFSLPARAEHALLAGAADYILKPVRREELAEAMEKVAGPVRRVLVVDDDEDTLWMVRQLLYACDEDLEVRTATGGGEALEMMRDGAPPDLVLLDVVMPDVSGWDVLSAMTRDEALADVPVVILSGKDPGEHPLSSRLLVTTMGEGLSVSQLLRCSRGIPPLLLRSD